MVFMVLNLPVTQILVFGGSEVTLLQFDGYDTGKSIFNEIREKSCFMGVASIFLKNYAMLLVTISVK